MSGVIAERRAGRSRRWMKDRRLLSERRIEDLTFDGSNQRDSERRAKASRRGSDRRDE